jgi:hypothetical protein
VASASTSGSFSTLAPLAHIRYDSRAATRRPTRSAMPDHAAFGGATVQLLAIAGLGAFHGLNPAMGWLFAVALGMQEGRRQAVLRALLPLTAGHAAAIAGAVMVVQAAGLVTPPAWLSTVAGVMLVALGTTRLIRQRHPRWVGMRVGPLGLTWWSTLMATAHGAGLMVLPLVLGSAATGAAAEHHHHAMAVASPGVLAVTLAHGGGYLLVTAALAVVVYETVGLGILRTAWINLDLIWAAALILTGVATLAW